MPTVVGIRFKDSGKVYYFDPQHTEQLTQGDHVIVETVRGPELAKVAFPPKDVNQGEIVGELKPVLRRAEVTDFERMRLLNERHDEILTRCSEKVQEHQLPMRLVKAEYSFDGSRLTFYFTAEKRVDFRLLVRDLARTFKTRIELRQIGPRDEAKLLGGIGPCGRLLCCATFLPDYARVSIKMAKDQDLPLNPSKISGVCGRLLCCLAYEHEQYLDIKSVLPRRGAWVQTPEGPGEVVAVNVVRETVTVMLAESGVQEEFDPSLLKEATERVAGVARSRNAEGITPAAQERKAQREAKHHGERRLLRDEIENPDVLDALALLEEGDWDDNGYPNVASDPRPRHAHDEPPRQRPSERNHDRTFTPRPRPQQGQEAPKSAQPEQADAGTQQRGKPGPLVRVQPPQQRPQKPAPPQPALPVVQVPKLAPHEDEAVDTQDQEQRPQDRQRPARRRRRGG